MNTHAPQELQRIYHQRFHRNAEYRRKIWGVLIEDFFQQYIKPADAVLDLGCGYAEFINQVKCGQKFAMDLNPEAPRKVAPLVKCLVQDCSLPWPLDDKALDVVFTSNFFEHLPDKEALGRTLDEAFRCLRSGGKLIAMGPNIKYLPGAYWDFWDHHLPLTELSLKEALESRGFTVETCLGKFLPYTIASGPQYPMGMLRIYLLLPVMWRFFGKQFLIVARK